MELDDFLYTSAGRGRYACFTGTNRLMFITHRLVLVMKHASHWLNTQNWMRSRW